MIKEEVQLKNLKIPQVLFLETVIILWFGTEEF